MATQPNPTQPRRQVENLVSGAAVMRERDRLDFGGLGLRRRGRSPTSGTQHQWLTAQGLRSLGNVLSSLCIDE